MELDLGDVIRYDEQALPMAEIKRGLSQREQTEKKAMRKGKQRIHLDEGINAIVGSMARWGDICTSEHHCPDQPKSMNSPRLACAAKYNIESAG